MFIPIFTGFLYIPGGMNPDFWTINSITSPFEKPPWSRGYSTYITPKWCRFLTWETSCNKNSQIWTTYLLKWTPIVSHLLAKPVIISTLLPRREIPETLNPMILFGGGRNRLTAQHLRSSSHLKSRRKNLDQRNWQHPFQRCCKYSQLMEVYQKAGNLICWALLSWRRSVTSFRQRIWKLRGPILFDFSRGAKSINMYMHTNKINVYIYILNI